MNAMNVLELLVLVWSFTAVCQPIGDFHVSCDDVTGTVGREVNFTCSIFQCNQALFTQYKFLYPESAREICKTKLPVVSCENLNKFTCSYTSNTTQTGSFRFFLQAQTSFRETTFIVNITDQEEAEHYPEMEEAQSVNTVATPTVSCFLILFVILFTAFCIMKSNRKPCGFQKRPYKDAIRKDDDIISPETV